MTAKPYRKGERTLVTGATGFIGTNLVRRLVAEGESVRILRRPYSNTRGLDELPIETAIGDVRDAESVRAAVEGCRRVYHLAAKLSVADGDWDRFHRTNVLGTENVARAALETGVERMLHCSSIAAVGWGPPQAPATEESEFNFESFRVPYVHTKRQGELVVREYIGKGLPAVIVNPAYVFGPWDKRLGANRLVYLVAKGRGLFYPGKGGINIVDVDDVVDGMLAAMDRGRVGERYILGGENLFFRDLLSLMAEVSGGRKPIATLPFPLFWSLALLVEIGGKLFHFKPLISRQTARFARLTHFVSSEKAMRELGYRYRPPRQVILHALQWLADEGYLHTPATPAVAKRHVEASVIAADENNQATTDL